MKEKRWIIIVDSYEGGEEASICFMNSVMTEYLPYPPAVYTLDGVSETLIEQNDLVIIGNPRRNYLVFDLIKEGTLSAPEEIEGAYSVCVKEKNRDGRSIIAVAAFDTCGLTYGAADLCNYYFGNRVFFGHSYNRNNKAVRQIPFSDFMPAYSRKSRPRVKRRGLWTWGHCIYDYEGYFRNMALMKLNEIVIWCDCPPINGKKVVECAHSYGIKVIFGYSWGWDVNSGTDMNLADRSLWQKKAESIVKQYEAGYMSFGGDGVYFQSFTETSNRLRDGVVIAEAVTEWVNMTSRLFLEKHPGLRLQFGLHATSVFDDTEYIGRIDERVEIVWEDLGAFPFSYYPENVSDFDKTIAFLDKAAVLRGKGDRFGMVLKGMTTLDWDNFRHYDGGFLLGKASPYKTEKLADEKKEIWRLIDPWWIKHSEYLFKTLDAVTEKKGDELSVQLLAEDGLIEKSLPTSLLLASESLWISAGDPEDTVTLVSLAKYVRT